MRPDMMKFMVAHLERSSQISERVVSENAKIFDFNSRYHSGIIDFISILLASIEILLQLARISWPSESDYELTLERLTHAGNSWIASIPRRVHGCENELSPGLSRVALSLALHTYLCGHNKSWCDPVFFSMLVAHNNRGKKLGAFSYIAFTA